MPKFILPPPNVIISKAEYQNIGPTELCHPRNINNVMIYLNLSVVACAYINTTRLSLKTCNSKQMKNIKNAYVCVSVCVYSHALCSKRNFAEPIPFSSSLIFLNNLLCMGIVGIMKSSSSRGTRRQKWVK